MYQGKHQMTKFHRRWNKSMILLVSMLLLLGVAVGGTIAFLMDTDGPIDNIFTPSEIATTVEEDITSGGVKKDVKIKNTGDTTAYIRAAVVITWQDASGNVYGSAPVANTDYTISINYNEQTSPEGKWILAEDGFYYWTKPVKSLAEAKAEVKTEGKTEDAIKAEIETKCCTGVLINSCSSTSNNSAPEGYYLNVEIIGSGIQSVPTDVVIDEWKSGVSGVGEDGTLTISVKEGGTE